MTRLATRAVLYLARWRRVVEIAAEIIRSRTETPLLVAEAKKALTDAKEQLPRTWASLPRHIRKLCAL
jgi:hypothetical protein